MRRWSSTASFRGPRMSLAHSGPSKTRRACGVAWRKRLVTKRPSDTRSPRSKHACLMRYIDRSYRALCGARAGGQSWRPDTLSRLAWAAHIPAAPRLHGNSGTRSIVLISFCTSWQPDQTASKRATNGRFARSLSFVTTAHYSSLAEWRAIQTIPNHRDATFVRYPYLLGWPVS